LRRKSSDAVFYASVHNHTAWPMLASEAAANYRAGQEGPIIIIGHSLGADAAVKMADELAQQRISVKLVVTFDPVSNMAVEGDIAKVVNLYISDGWACRWRAARNFAARWSIWTCGIGPTSGTFSSTNRRRCTSRSSATSCRP